MFEFRVIAECPVTGARAGELVTPHGVIKTPVFMPVGTLATVKSMSLQELEGGRRTTRVNAQRLFMWEAA